MFIPIDIPIIATTLIVILAVFSVLSWALYMEASKIFKLYQNRIDDLQEIANHWQNLAKDYAKIIKETKF